LVQAPRARDTAAAWAIRIALAAYGFSLAIALAPRLALRARPGELLSALKLSGYSPAGLVLQFAAAVALTALAAIAGAYLAPLFEGRRWAAVAFCGALALAPIALMHFGNLKHVLLAGVAAAAVVLVRKREPHFVLGDVVLIPAVFACEIAFLDLHFGGTPVAAFLRAVIAVFAFRLLVPVADAWVAAPLALMAENGLLPPKTGGYVALLILFGLPFLFARLRIRAPRKWIYPAIVLLYPMAVLRLPPTVGGNLFEDSHNVTVASEMLRGERPYADIIPTHGIISDGALDAVALKFSHRSLRAVLATRLVVGMLSGVAIYCLGVAATGSLEAGLLTAILAFLLASGSTLWIRPSAALFALAAVVAGTRLRSRRWFIAGGALTVLAYFVSVDFGVYSALVALVAAFRARALRALAIGVAAAAVPSLVIFAIFGFALDFFRATFVEILGSHSAYFVAPIAIPDCLRSPALVQHLGGCVNPMTWALALLATCAAMARSPLRARRDDAPWLIGMWIVVAAASYIERGNEHFYPAVVPFLVAALWYLARYARTVAIVLAVILALVAEPFRHVITVIPEVRAQKQGPLFDATTETSIKAAGEFIRALPPQETFVDFSNSALLYAIYERDCPLRQVEVANYQNAEAQRQVIARIEGNPHIRAALIAFPGSNPDVDGVKNSDRAPLVWAYLQSHFAPGFERDGVVFWKRVR
jgi:hypothetical protein